MCLLAKICCDRTQVSALVGRLRGELRPSAPGEEEQVFDGGQCFISERGSGVGGVGDDLNDGSSCCPESLGRCGRNDYFGDGGGNAGHILSNCRERGCTSGHGREPRSGHPGRYKNAAADLGAICEGGGGNDAVEAETRRMELCRGGVEVDGLDSSSTTEKEQMQRLLHMGDGGSDDTADTADGATDHEDVHTEEDDSGSLPPNPNDEEHDKSSNTSSTSSTSSASSASSGGGGGTSSHNSSRSNMSSSNPNSDTEAYGNSSAASDHRHHDSGVGTTLAGGVAARVSPPGKRRLAPVRHGAAAAASAGVEGVPPSAFRRRGWSSSKLALSGVDADAAFTGRRRASEDLAVSVKVCVVGGAVGGACHSRRVDYAAFNSNATPFTACRLRLIQLQRNGSIQGICVDQTRRTVPPSWSHTGYTKL